MVDVVINKYLETQLALAKQKDLKSSKQNKVSDKSKKAALRISNRQHKFPKSNKDEITPRVVADINSEDDDEYLPTSDDEDSTEIHLPNLQTSSRQRQTIKKITDDGDSNLYKIRLTNWKSSINNIKSGLSEISYMSADIQYLLDGNKNVDEKHELQNGLNIPVYIWKQLYKYQRTGVKWLWELHQIQSGGLLGDEMGLGKTVQIIAFLAGLANTDCGGTWGGLGPSIIVAPATVVFQWVSHFHYWYPSLRVAALHQAGSFCGNHHKLIRELHDSHGILLVTYAGIVKYAKDLQARHWNYIILDEGHKIRNPDTQVSKHVKKFQTPHKLLITGSPMQNSLQELWSLFDFMRPGLLGTNNAFTEHFAIPITQGGYANSTQMQEATALEIAKALKNLITPYMLRRTKEEVQQYIHLPEKNEQVLFCALTQEQRDLYMGYLLSGTVRSILDRDSKVGDPLRARILVALSTLRKICNHPDIYLHEAHEDTEEIDEKSFGHWKRSGKMNVVHSLLKIWQKQGHRMLMFSQSRAMLCIIEQYLQNHDYKYLKMDGTVSVGQRQSLIKAFNDNTEYLVFLSTTRVGGLGVNLTGADRVIIYDPDWNPATDNQAKERAWRIGQEKNVTVYRLLSAGTIEEKIYQRQIFKNFLSNKILVDPNQRNVLTTSTLQGLFTLEELNCEGDTETASLFKHTKITVKKKSKEKDKSNLASTKKKIDAMKKLAKQISNKITTLSNNKDPRELYKKKRDALLNPPIEEERHNKNTLNDKIVEEPFENVLSELDIINQHVKKDYEEKLLKDIMSTESNVETTDTINVADTQNKNELDRNSCEAIETKLSMNKSTSISINKSRKRKLEITSDHCIENLVSVKKVKHKKEEKCEKSLNDDNYVLTKLFAKAGVKNALQHDVVVGLAEKEKRLRMQEEAMLKAKKAVRAIKFSSK
ncbi:DNA excision repair protein ERCC-6-like [Leptidea sinapis]|uniref:DNA excision repair protein ERCC-6-like n=1 Tax=Leptidea sinapis TaxID=189913 RepID=UPI0021C3C153|nr:DNA excision repair protein ERCC-6-like [Leptidea sinapis]